MALGSDLALGSAWEPELVLVLRLATELGLFPESDSVVGLDSASVEASEPGWEMVSA